MQRQFPLSVFVFIDSLVVSALQDADGYAISRQNNLELHLGCHICWLSYFTLICLWCGRTVSRAGGRAGGRCTVTWLPNFLGWVDYFIFLPMVLRWRASRARAPLIVIVIIIIILILIIVIMKMKSCCTNIYCFDCYQKKSTIMNNIDMLLSGVAISLTWPKTRNQFS